ncbi:4'-phosphopantetheinyl transferase superfamily protein [Streptomyces sp. SID2888]|uniref:4'-phosphopantetheinyl transferase family protein n=1 Tax=Streptomyces sp. SID2888 TaxID=2690256 RepID=UPI00136F93B9|nr:4'-phosphopantetheinyl transferase superfamily protein [Streptomyces sp. SID2888]MYV49607.1 4'-phosphopantetheinyl transferase superfamily protein [Streptomyces sp. SID2888]
MVTGRGGSDVLVACAPLAVAGARHDLLSPAESARAAAYPPMRAREFTAGRALLRWALARRLGPGARTCRIGVTGRGKPVLEDLSSAGISISHSGETVAVAVSAGVAVGIDAQAPVPPTPGLLSRCCSPEQQRELFALPPERRAAALARRWTIHEACAKATGEGLTRRPRICPGPLLADTGRWCHLGWRALPPVLECALAVAFSRPAERAVVRVALVKDLGPLPGDAAAGTAYGQPPLVHDRFSQKKAGRR